jgi:hypothetical protein
MRGEEVVPASRVPELPRNRVKAQPNAPCELLGRNVFRSFEQAIVGQLVEPLNRVLQGARHGRHGKETKRFTGWARP